jgi:DNA topoisomerase-1
VAVSDPPEDLGDLCYVDVSEPGITRIRCGRGFRYNSASGDALRDRRELDRIRALAVPPAWQEVWICPDPDGHIQAVGTDAAGRRQYLYHDSWRERRDRSKFDRILRLAERLPEVRAEVAHRLEARGLGRDRVLAGALRMLELGAFRVGGEQYAPDDSDDQPDDDPNGSFGLATLRRDHVRRLCGEVRVSYLAKGGALRELALRDPALHRLVGSLLRSKAATAATEDLLVYRVGRSWHDVRSEDINAYLKELAGDEFTAKDLRTWNATVLGAVALAGVDQAQMRTVRGRKRALSAAYREVAGHLGNTPAVARQSYVDPRVVHEFEQGRTVAAPIQAAAQATGDGIRAAAEPALIELLRASVRERGGRAA